MKKVIVSASVIALLIGVLSLAGDAWSQQARDNGDSAAPNIPHKVGLIDMAYIFKNYKKFETLREDLKVEIAASEEKAKAMQAEILELQKTMKSLQEGSPEYTKNEKLAVQQAANFENFRRQMSRQFLKAESQVYLQVYNEVSKMVEKYAKAKDYTLIIRFNRDELDTENPQALLQGMNRQVVYYRANEDITTPVLDALNKKMSRSADEQGTPTKRPINNAEGPKGSRN